MINRRVLQSIEHIRPSVHEDSQMLDRIVNGTSEDE
jgi:hypothetical protein